MGFENDGEKVTDVAEGERRPCSLGLDVQRRPWTMKRTTASAAPRRTRQRWLNGASLLWRFGEGPIRMRG
jgi:hypothetical protein